MTDSDTLKSEAERRDIAIRIRRCDLEVRALDDLEKQMKRMIRGAKLEGEAKLRMVQFMRRWRDKARRFRRDLGDLRDVYAEMMEMTA